MKRTHCGIAVLTLILILSAAHAAVAAPPRVSPTASASQVVGVSEIDVTYARPSVNERAIWGELVPYDQVWRTGANEATKITFSHDAKIEGKPLSAGTYALFTLPEKGKWTIIFNKEAEQWGAFNHKAEQDVLRVEVRPKAAPFQEQLAVGFSDVGTRSAKVVLHWEKLAAAFEVEFDTPKIAYEVAVKEAGENPQASFGWANYFYQENVYTDKALEWTSAAVEARPIYWTFALKARLLERTGEKGEAMELAKRAIQLAEEGENQFAKQAAGQLEEEMAAW